MILTSLSAVLAVDALGGLDQAFSVVEQWWPLGLVALGIIRLMSAIPSNWGFLGPTALVVLGLVALVASLNGSSLNYGLRYVAIAGLGLGGLTLGLVGISERERSMPLVRGGAVLGGKRLTSINRVNFASIYAVLGKIELDLTHARIDRNIDVFVTCVLGSVDIALPSSVLINEVRRTGYTISVSVIHDPLSDGRRRTARIREAVNVSISVLGIGASVRVTGQVEDPDTLVKNSESLGGETRVRSMTFSSPRQSQTVPNETHRRPRRDGRSRLALRSKESDPLRDD
jgi:hypothetical protein